MKTIADLLFVIFILLTVVLLAGSLILFFAEVIIYGELIHKLLIIKGLAGAGIGFVLFVLFGIISDFMEEK